MQRSRSLGFLPLDPEIERSLCQIRRENKQREQVEDMANDDNR